MLKRMLIIQPTKSYLTAANALMAIEKCPVAVKSKARYFIMQYTGSEPKHIGRFFPVFIGMTAVEDGIHHHFNVIG